MHGQICELEGQVVTLVPTHQDNQPRNWLVEDAGTARLIYGVRKGHLDSKYGEIAATLNTALRGQRPADQDDAKRADG